MDDKIIDILGKILENQTEMTTQLKELNSRVTSIETTMENELNDRIRALYDARQVQNDVNERVLGSLERIEQKVDTLQLETLHIRKVK